MKRVCAAGVVFLAMLGMVFLVKGGAADASDAAPSVTIEKTFDQGTLVEHTLMLVRPPHTVSLRVSQRRSISASEGR